MLLRILGETFVRRKRRVALAVVAVLIGSALATALLSISTDVMEKMARELRSYGANILIEPQSAALPLEVGGVSFQPVSSQRYLDEGDLVKLKTIFWRNNIVGFAPYLSTVVTLPDGERAVLTGTWFDYELRIPEGTAVVSGLSERSIASAAAFRTGVKTVSPWWKVQGRWAADDAPEEAMVGVSLAQRLGLRPGDSLRVIAGGSPKERSGESPGGSADGFEARADGEGWRDLRVVGIVSTGSYEDGQIFAPLGTAQSLLGMSNGVNRVLVSALTLPKEKLAPDIRDKRPEEMTPEEYEKWYCSPVIDAVVTQIKEVIPGAEVKPIRQISEAEASFAVKIQFLVFTVAAVALLASALGVLTTMTTTVLERRAEIGLMKAIGAENSQVASVFLAEAALIGVAGGILGYAGGWGLASYIGARVFNSPPTFNPLVLPVALILAVGVALLGSALPVRAATRIEPINLLRGG